MTEKPPPRRTKSGENPIAIAFRAKLDSIREGTIPHLEELNRQADELRAKHKSDAPAEPEPEPEGTEDDAESD